MLKLSNRLGVKPGLDILRKGGMSSAERPAGTCQPQAIYNYLFFSDWLNATKQTITFVVCINPTRSSISMTTAEVMMLGSQLQWT